MFKTKLILAALLATGVSGCVSTGDGERALIGAGVGAAAAAITDNDLATGALIGAAGGALCDDAGVAADLNRASGRTATHQEPSGAQPRVVFSRLRPGPGATEGGEPCSRKS